MTSKNKRTAAKPAAKPPTATSRRTAKTKTEPRVQLLEKYRAHAGDTGSTEVQIALLTERIEAVTRHLAAHAGDQDSRRGLLMMVGKRRRLLNYLKKENPASYPKLIADLGLRK